MEVAELRKQRDAARARGDWALADQLRDRLAAAGVSLTDAKASAGKRSAVVQRKADAASKHARRREKRAEEARLLAAATAKNAAAAAKASKKRARPRDAPGAREDARSKRAAPSCDPLIAREDATIKALEQKLGLSGEKERAHFRRELEQDGFDEGFGDFLADLDGLSARIGEGEPRKKVRPRAEAVKEDRRNEEEEEEEEEEPDYFDSSGDEIPYVKRSRRR